jgi:hypothetical protein
VSGVYTDMEQIFARNSKLIMVWLPKIMFGWKAQ